VRRTDARSAQIGGPDSIAQCFQVRANSGEPFTSKAARNLLSNDDWRKMLGNEPEELGPEVTLIGCTFLSTGDAEGLAGTGAGPDGEISGPGGELEG
jgi:hypothetical protein